MDSGQVDEYIGGRGNAHGCQGLGDGGDVEPDQRELIHRWFDNPASVPVNREQEVSPDKLNAAVTEELDIPGVVLLQLTGTIEHDAVQIDTGGRKLRSAGMYLPRAPPVRSNSCALCASCRVSASTGTTWTTKRGPTSTGALPALRARLASRSLRKVVARSTKPSANEKAVRIAWMPIGSFPIELRR
jgi:hypothetical protein